MRAVHATRMRASFGSSHGAARGTEAPNRLSIARSDARTTRQALVETRLEMCRWRAARTLVLSTLPTSNRERKRAPSDANAATGVTMEGRRARLLLGPARPSRTPSSPSHLIGRNFFLPWGLTRDVRVSLTAARGPCASATQAPPRALLNRPPWCAFRRLLFARVSPALQNVL